MEIREIKYSCTEIFLSRREHYCCILYFSLSVFTLFLKIKFCTATHYAWQLDNTIRYDGLILFANVNVYYYFTSHNKQIYYHRSHCVAKCTRTRLKGTLREKENECVKTIKKRKWICVRLCVCVYEVYEKKIKIQSNLIKEKVLSRRLVSYERSWERFTFSPFTDYFCIEISSLV